ncbi:MAG: transglutaminase family protein [Pseudomonadota bacterium]|nr:transglutaminase family protein [Pseudomonadota bacterium]
MIKNDEMLLREALADARTVGPLARAALVVARHADPALDVERYAALIEGDSATLRQQVPADASRATLIARLNHFLFEERGYRGNHEHYYDPRNSLLNAVIDRRLGIPITLCILYLEIGRGLGLPLEGVAFPGHFLVKCPMDRGMVILDPFNGGVSLSEQGLRERLEQQELNLHERPEVQDWLRPADRRAIVARLLRNLKRIYADGGQISDAIKVLSLLVVADPGSARDLRERGNLFRRMECWGAAVSDLESALALGGLGADEAEETRQVLVELRARPRLLH